MKRLVVLFVFLLFSFTFISAGQLQVTEEHPFLVNGSWISASDLKVGDILTTSDGKNVTIKKITDIGQKTKVYNLEAGIFHNFVVGDENVVVHNSNALQTLAPEDKIFLKLVQTEELAVYEINKRGVELDHASLFNRAKSMLPQYSSVGGWTNLDELLIIGQVQKLRTYEEWREIGNVGRVFDLATHLDDSGRLVLYGDLAGKITSESPQGTKFIWTLDRQGNLNLGFRDEFGSYVYRSGEKILPHSVLSGGKPVFGAGEVTFVNGEVSEVNAWSGHYVDAVGSVTFNQNTIKAFQLYLASHKLKVNPDVKFITESPSPYLH